MDNSIEIKANRAKGLQLFGFSFNNASTNAAFVLFSLYFLVYCTEIYGFSPLLVGAIMTGTRLFDAFTDPLIGVYIDRTDTKFGRFRPWIFGGALVSASMIVLMFSGITTGSNIGNIILVICIYSVWVLGYTAQTICTKCGQNIVTAIPKQRSQINALGLIFTIIVYILAASGLVMIFDALGGIVNSGTWRVVGIIFASIQMVFAVFVVLGIRKKDIPKNYLKVKACTVRPRFWDYISIFRKNKALQMLIVAASTNKLTTTMKSGLTMLFFFYVSRNPELQTPVTAGVTLLMIIAVIIMIKVINKFGRKEIFTFSSWAGFIYGLAAIFLVALFPSSAVWLIIVLGLNLMLSAGTEDINLISMIGDSADYEYYKNNRFIPGMVGAAFSFIDKGISAFGSLVIGAILTGIGFISISTTPQTPTMFWVILIMYFGFPALGHLCSVIAMKYYPLNKKFHEKMLKDLAEKDG